MTVFKGFEPFYDKNSRILILGSFPSVKSRDVNFYYGNPQNRFWKILANAYNEVVPVTIDEKKSLLSRRKIALWDIVTECEIEGSLDSAIKNPKIADLYAVLNSADIVKILTNGTKSNELTLRCFPELSDKIVKLPSTSPANTRFSPNSWIKELRSF